MRTIEANDLADTARIAADVAERVSAGTCVTLEGDLGAGKTTFVRALVAALGGDPRDVSSPTYVLLHVYATPRITVFHLDAYRVGGADDFESIGFVDLLGQRGVVIVEWASRVRDALPTPNRIDVRIDVTGPTSRQITVEYLP